MRCMEEPTECEQSVDKNEVCWQDALEVFVYVYICGWVGDSCGSDLQICNSISSRGNTFQYHIHGCHIKLDAPSSSHTSPCCTPDVLAEALAARSD